MLMNKYKDKQPFEFQATGTLWKVEIFEETKSDIFDGIRSVVESYESKLSRFRKNSLLTKLNTTGVIEFDKDFDNLINIYLKLSEITQERFTLFSTNELVSAGYGPKFKSIRNHRLEGVSEIIITPKEIILNTDKMIDFGAVGKGLIVDKVKEFILYKGISEFLINAGGDIYFNSKKNSMPIALENPFDNEQYISKVKLKNSSVAGSANDKRKWIFENKIKKHIFDSKNPERQIEIAAVFAIGDSCTSSDAASTSIFVSDQTCWDAIREFLGVEFLVIFSNSTYYSSKRSAFSMN